MIYLGILFLALSILFWKLNSRDQYNWVAISHGILACLVFFLVGNGIPSTDEKLLSSGLQIFILLSSILILNMVFSHFWKKSASYWPPLFVLLSSILLFLAPESNYLYGEFGVSLTSLSVFLLPFLGSIIQPIAEIKEETLANYFHIDYKNSRGFSRSVYFFFFGMFALFSLFVASYLGLALFTLGFASSLYYGKKTDALWNFLLALFALTLLGYFADIANITESSLLLGRVLTGIFFAGFIALFQNTITRARKQKSIATFLSWFLVFFLTSALILGGKMNVNFGGGDAFIGLLVGFSLAAAFGINTRKNSSLLALYIALGIFLVPLTINNEAEKMTKISVSTTENTEETKTVDAFEMPGKKMELEGKYKIKSANSQLTFELGPNGGRTKGAFKTFEGNFEFGETSKIQVKLPVKQLSTFNSYRDESLMEASYFDEAKYPEMNFEASSMKQNGDFYDVEGNFTMLAKTKSIKLEMKYLGKATDSENEIFIGRSSLNRVDFGMKSDPKEGDVVDFQFKVELEKK